MFHDFLMSYPQPFSGFPVSVGSFCATPDRKEKVGKAFPTFMEEAARLQIHFKR